MHVVDELGRLSDERFLHIYEALAENGFGPLDGEVAKALKFRPQAIRKLPMERRAKRARAIVASRRNAELAYELFGGYLMKATPELIPAFLDATGVEHEDGIISGVENATPDADKVAEAVRALDERFDAEDVTLYLAMATQNWPDVEPIARLWSERAGVDEPPPAGA